MHVDAHAANTAATMLYRAAANLACLRREEQRHSATSDNNTSSKLPSWYVLQQLSGQLMNMQELPHVQQQQASAVL